MIATRKSAGLLSLVLAMAFVPISVGCSREKSAEQIYDENASGVVMILNEHYYSVTLPTGETFYFSGIEDGKLKNVAFSPSQPPRG